MIIRMRGADPALRRCSGEASSGQVGGIFLVVLGVLWYSGLLGRHGRMCAALRLRFGAGKCAYGGVVLQAKG